MARLWDYVYGHPDRRWGGGVYALYLRGALIYIGRTSSFFLRIQQHRRRLDFDAIKVAPIEDAAERRALERKLLRRLRPPCNRSLPARSR